MGLASATTYPPIDTFGRTGDEIDFITANATEENNAAKDSEPTWWKPGINTLWQWHISGTNIDTSIVVDVFDIDYEETSASTIASLKARGRKVICYMSVGSWEDWRGDKDDFPAIIVGRKYDGWPGEKWLDIRRIDLLGPILEARLDMCRDKGFDAIEPDNMDGYTNKTGFPLTYQDQLTFNIWLADAAHKRGLSIGLKNNSDQAVDLLPYYDWAMTEDCFADDYTWCHEMQPFIDAGKAVFVSEYTDTGMRLNKFCDKAISGGFRGILKKRDLGGWWESCDGNKNYANTPISVEPNASVTIADGESQTWATESSISIEGELIVKDGAFLNLFARNHTFNPGFRVETGAWFRAGH